MTMSPAAAEPRFSSLVPSLMAQYTTAAAAAAEEQQHRSSSSRGTARVRLLKVTTDDVHQLFISFHSAKLATCSRLSWTHHPTFLSAKQPNYSLKTFA